MTTKFTGEPFYVDVRAGDEVIITGTLSSLDRVLGECGDMLQLTTIESAHNEYAAGVVWKATEEHLDATLECVLGGRSSQRVSILRAQMLITVATGLPHVELVLAEVHDHG